jgi:rubrerythrin
MAASGSCTEELEASICHLLEEEETHKRILSGVREGKVRYSDLEQMLGRHRYEGFDALLPLTGKLLDQWSADISTALDREEKTWVFYGNLRRMSKIPVVRKAFEVLASMEKEHVDILRRLLGKA